MMDEFDNSVCWSCVKELDPYETVHVWKLVENGHQVFVCDSCHNKLLPILT